MTNSAPRARTAAVRIALIYALAGGLWILFSDKAVQLMFRDPTVIMRISIAKGWLYVAVTAALLFLMIRQAFREIEQSRDALHRSEGRYRALFEGSRDALLIHEGPEWGFVSCNKAALELLGVASAEELRPLGPSDISPEFQPDGERSADKARAMLERALAESSHFFDWRCRRRDGQEFDATVLLTRIDVGGQVAIQATIRDETDRRRIQDALRESERKYRDLVENANSIILMLDTQGNVTFLNAFGERFFGFSKEELQGRNVVGTIAPLGASKSGQNPGGILREILADPDRSRDIENENVTRDGRTVWVRWANRVVLDDSGALAGILCIGNDVSDRKKAEADRLEMERRLLHGQKLESLGVLAGGIAHDFNNLLTAIIGNLDIALDGLPASSAAGASIERSLRASLRAADLTRQMLAYSGRGRSIVEPVSLNELVEENLHLLRASVSKTVTISLRLADDLAAIPLDAAQVQQVVMNLITNASEAVGEAPGTIVLTTGVQECDEASLAASRLEEKPAPGRFVYLEVRDTGCGMDSATQQRVFDPFFTTKFTGRGLGMSAVLGIVRSHHGAILLESEIGEGTTIRVLFPEGGLPRTDAVQRRPSEAMQSRSATVLVVDDEEMVRDSCRLLLERLGYRVLTAENGRDAVQTFREHADDVSCVLLDLTMPVMDGEGALRELIQIRPDVKAILSTGYGREDANERFSDLKLAGFIQKPYRLRDLKEKLESALGS